MSNIQKFLFKRSSKDCKTAPAMQNVSFRGCRKGSTCRKAGCGRDHHYLIHSDEGNGNGTCPTSCNVSRSAEDSGAAEKSVTEPLSPPVPTAVRVNPVTPPILDDPTSTSSSDPVTVGAVRAS